MKKVGKWASRPPFLARVNGYQAGPLNVWKDIIAMSSSFPGNHTCMVWSTENGFNQTFQF